MLTYHKNNVIGKYKNGNYDVVLLRDGTKIRIQKDDDADFIPSFAESMDITITEKCDGGCKYCYAGCTPDGTHADLFKYNWINTIHPFTELAINGNDLSHPQLVDFLKFAKSRKAIVNITVNQRHFMEHVGVLYDWQNKELIHGIGISYTHPQEQFFHFLSKFKNTVIHTIAGILTSKDISYLAQNGDNINLLILGYKNKGRGVDYILKNEENVITNIAMLEGNYQYLIEHFKVVSFDNLALNQLHIKDKLSSAQWEELYMGDEGSATFFIDAVNGRFARSSMDIESFPIEVNGIIDNVDKMFTFIRDEYNGKIEGENKI